MKNIIKQNWILITILLLAAALRLYVLNKVPPSMHWDETALGYNAYSILKTGKDEYGKFLPLIFKSFGDYKPGLYVYLTVPSVAIFGLNELAVRLPSALIGIAIVWLFYKLIFLLLKNKSLALFSSFALAVSPWHLQFSRSAWEANVALFFLLGGIYCFIKAKKQTIKWLYLSALGFSANILTYQSGKMIVPMIILGLLIFFKEKLKVFPKKHLFIAFILFCAISLPIILSSVTGGGGRLKVMSLFSYRRPKEEINQILQEDKGNQFYFDLFYSENINFVRGILSRYFNHFSGKFLFFEGDWSSARHSVPYAGVLYYVDIIFLLAGVAYMIRVKSSNFLWYWLFISPLPAALSRDAIESVRAINMVLPLMIVIGAGIQQTYLWIKQGGLIIRYSLLIILLSLYLWNFAYYLDQYYIHFPKQSSQYWQYGYKNVVDKIYPIRNNYSRIIFTQKWGQPYIYWLFYTQYNPVNYQKQAKLTENPWGDVGEIQKLDNIEFRNIYWPNDRSLKKTLFVGIEDELPLQDINPDQARIIDEIKFLNGEVAFRIVETL